MVSCSFLICLARSLLAFRLAVSLFPRVVGAPSLLARSIARSARWTFPVLLTVSVLPFRQSRENCFQNIIRDFCVDCASRGFVLGSWD